MVVKIAAYPLLFQGYKRVENYLDRTLLFELLLFRQREDFFLRASNQQSLAFFKLSMSLNTCTASAPVFKAVAIVVVARKTSITTAHSGKLLGGVSSGGSQQKA